ncbi:hypothetical protein GCM10007061_14460 [Kocuria marina]|nr:hypothetical protein GCM10007061_14460 [Kocuria marina]
MAVLLTKGRQVECVGRGPGSTRWVRSGRRGIQVTRVSAPLRKEAARGPWIEPAGPTDERDRHGARVIYHVGHVTRTCVTDRTDDDAGPAES